MIVTWLRAEYIEQALHCLASEPFDQLIVVDASLDTRTREVAARFTGVEYIHFPRGAGHMTTARNVGLKHVRSDITAFLDDDAYVRTGWANSLKHVFQQHPEVGGVAGRALTGQSIDDEAVDPDIIGRVTERGDLTANFHAHVRGLVSVEHGIGANMAFSTSLLLQLGGLRDDFPGTAIREDTDVFLRVRGLGQCVIYCSSAAVDHVGAPHIKGQRFDWRYNYYRRRNHLLLLARNYGLASTQFRAYLADEVRGLGRAEPGTPIWRTSVRAVYGAASVIVGVIVSVAKAHLAPTNPIKTDPAGQELRRMLMMFADP